jgi:RNA polymerase sigma-70 factor (ECF subfamily)
LLLDFVITGSIRVQPEFDMQQDSPDHYEEFVRFYTRSEPDIRAFVRSLMPTWTDADEVLQQTALVLWKKFDQFDTTGDAVDFVKWACASHSPIDERWRATGWCSATTCWR